MEEELGLDRGPSVPSVLLLPGLEVQTGRDVEEEEEEEDEGKKEDEGVTFLCSLELMGLRL